jgi:hypothetical protein
MRQFLRDVQVGDEVAIAVPEDQENSKVEYVFGNVTKRTLQYIEVEIQGENKCELLRFKSLNGTILKTENEDFNSSWLEDAGYARRATDVSKRKRQLREARRAIEADLQQVLDDVLADNAADKLIEIAKNMKIAFS